MKKAQETTTLGQEIIASLKEGLEHAQGKIELRSHTVTLPDEPPKMSKKTVKDIRKQLNVSQAVLARFLGVSGDRCVARGDANSCIGHEQRHVGAFQMLAGHNHAELLRKEVCFAFAPDARGVDEAIPFSATEDDRIHRVSGGSRFGGHDGAFRAGQLIQQRRLADIRPANDGHLHLGFFRSGAFRFCWRRKIAR